MTNVGHIVPSPEIHRLITYIQGHPHESTSQISKVLSSFENLVYFLVNKYRKPGSEDFADLVQIGFVGLLTAVNKFDVSRDVKFMTYATKVIEGHLLTYLSSETKHCRNRYSPHTHYEGEAWSDNLLTRSEFDNSFELDLITFVDSKAVSRNMRVGLESLPTRQHQAIRLFFYADHSKSVIAERMGVSRPRVTALLNDAINSLRRRLKI